MKRIWMFRLCLLSLGIALAWKGWIKVQDDPGMMFLYFIFMGSIGGLITVKTILPWAAEALSMAIHFPATEQKPEEAEAERTDHEELK